MEEACNSILTIEYHIEAADSLVKVPKDNMIVQYIREEWYESINMSEYDILMMQTNKFMSLGGERYN